MGSAGLLSLYHPEHVVSTVAYTMRFAVLGRVPHTTKLNMGMIAQHSIIVRPASAGELVLLNIRYAGMLIFAGAMVQIGKLISEVIIRRMALLMILDWTPLKCAPGS